MKQLRTYKNDGQYITAYVDDDSLHFCRLVCDGIEMESRKQTQKFLESSVYGLYSNRNFDFYDIQMMPIDYSIPSDIGIGSDQLRKLANHGKVNSWENSGYQRGVGTKDKAKFLKAVKNRRSKKK